MPYCIRCRQDGGHLATCEVVAFRGRVAGVALMQLEEAQIARRYRLSQTVVEQVGQIVDALG